MSGAVAFEGELNSIVKEYLSYIGFDKAVAMFDKECSEKGTPVASLEVRPQSSHRSVNLQQELMRLFQTGRGRQFFEMWTENLSLDIRNNDTVAQKLEFYLSVYFAIYPIKHDIDGHNDGMEQLRHYLMTRGAQLSETTEFLPFYALPYVPDPKQHASYKDLFLDKWSQSLKVRLEKFLSLALQSIPQPRLLELYSGTSFGKGSRALEQQLSESEKRLNYCMKKFTRVQNDYRNLIDITASLVDTLELSVQGSPVSPEYIHEIYVKLFSSQVRQTTDFSRPGTAGKTLRDTVAPPMTSGAVQQKKHSKNTEALDYEKIKADLIASNERKRAFLLQALRWKLTKSSQTEREIALMDYIKNDIFGCTKPGLLRKAIIDLLNSKSDVLKQYTARLLNTISSFTEGRTYLSLNEDLLLSLMSNVQQDSSDNQTLENMLGCLQKLSLRRQVQILMINEDMINWVVKILDDVDPYSGYMAENAAALLMNLSLRTIGKLKCKPIAPQLLRVLTNLLTIENPEVVASYVNGTLYSILTVPEIYEEAASMGLAEILKRAIKEDTPDMNKQIGYLIKYMNTPDDRTDVESDKEDDEEEDNIDGEEGLDMNEVLKPHSGELTGNSFLQTHYADAGGLSVPQKKRPTADNVLQRPITPSYMKMMSEQNIPDQKPSSAIPRDQRSHPGSATRQSPRDIQRPPTRSGSRPNSSGDVPADIPTRSTPPKTGDHEQTDVFKARPKIMRTPDLGGRPASRGDLQPKYSDYLPSSRPGSGTSSRPTSTGGARQTRQT